VKLNAIAFPHFEYEAILPYAQAQFSSIFEVIELGIQKGLNAS
jgi:hypothetical protein